jgi:hypothetical protein
MLFRYWGTVSRRNPAGAGTNGPEGVPPAATPPVAIPPVDVPPAFPVDPPPPVELAPELEEFLGPPGMSPTLARHPRAAVDADANANDKRSPAGANIRTIVDWCSTRVRAR